MAFIALGQWFIFRWRPSQHSPAVITVPTNDHHSRHLVEPPYPETELKKNQYRTLYFLPGRENKCNGQFDYICKFWFYIRCYVYAAFPIVQMLSLGPDSAAEFKRVARSGDIAVIIWRSKNHSDVPPLLSDLLQWRAMDKNAPRVRIGVFHVANEVIRNNWPWYDLPDFIIRNYWIPNLPPHATYIPLGHQLPNNCQPWSTLVSQHNLLTEHRACTCSNLAFKATSQRRYLWNFSGSLRKRRAELLKKLRHSPMINDKGYVQVSKKFGGTGVFGSESDNPKTEYLQAIMESKFVFAPCGNAMETHRIYEAVALGAIPIIENCHPAVSHFFPVKRLLFDAGTDLMISFVERFMNDPEAADRLQAEVMNWWASYTDLIALNVSRVVLTHFPQVSKKIVS